MKLRLAAVLVVAAFAIAAPSVQAEPGRDKPAARETAAGRTFHQLLDDHWEWCMNEFPEWATFVGDARYNDRWTDISVEAIAARRAYDIKLLERTKAIKRAKLDANDQLNYDLFLNSVERDVEGQRFHGEYIQMTQMGGVQQDIADMAQNAPRKTAKDVEDYTKRLVAAPKFVDQVITLMRTGMEKKITPPRLVLGNVAGNISMQIVDKAEDSPIYESFYATLPETISESDRTRLRAEGAAAISTHVVPAYRKLLKFWNEEYLPATRETIGLSALPDGADWYAYNVRGQTTTDLTPDQIHATGLSEVKRIREEMEKVRRQAGFDGNLGEFFTFLRTDPQFFYTKREDLLGGYRDIAKRIDPELPKLFRTLPRLTYGVIPVPEYSEKTQTTAYYMPGAPEVGRAGYFYANLYDLPSRPKWEMEALTLHEAVPGHHFQIARAQELGELPKFRQHGHYTAFVEGWGLYSESLGPEMGMFKDPYMKFGQLTYEMWRAIRLVVDTGIHSKGWTRDQAIAYFVENAGKSQHDIEVEVDRYIVWPGQALAYKIGELKIKELRAYAEKELGDKFDVRDFHDRVLDGGALPLAVLETRIKDWVAEVKSPQKKR